MICLMCRQAETIGGFTSVDFTRGKMRLLITDVPARICPSCGEAYVDEEVATRLLRDVEEESKAGMSGIVSEYRIFPRNTD